jgi:hypothetical protein
MMNGKADQACREVLREVLEERRRQHDKFGQQNPPNGTGGCRATEIAGLVKAQTDRAIREGTFTWRHILEEEVCEALAEYDPVKLRAELIQVAAVVCQWVEALDRRNHV